MSPRALIAEDEPLLAESLRAELAALWPELEIVTVGDGEAAIGEALARRPDIVFLDIRMPGLSGLEAAQGLAEDWPEHEGAFPLLVFVTAYDQYALKAFERAAVERLRGLLGASAGAASAPPQVEPLRVLQVGVGNAIHMVPIGDVLYLEAADKHVRVVTAQREHLIRISLRELLPRLDADRFWQIHRGSVVRADAIESVVREDSGRVVLKVQGRPDKLVVSRLYSPRFKAM